VMRSVGVRTCRVFFVFFLLKTIMRYYLYKWT
jgi:hypothetical protein